MTTCNVVCVTEFKNNGSYFCKGNEPNTKYQKQYSPIPVTEWCKETVNE